MLNAKKEGFMRKTILKSAVLLSLFTIVGKGIGFLRMMVVAFLFGADYETDAYYLANGMVSNILYALTTAIAVSFLPIYIKKKVEKGKDETARYTSNIITVLSILSILVSLIVCIGAPFFAKLSAPTYNTEQLSQVTLYFRVLSVGIIFSLITSLLKSLLDAEEIYGYGALSGIIYSVVTMAFAVLFFKSLGIMSLVVSVPVAYFIQYIFLNVRVRTCVNIKFQFDLHDKDLKILILSSIPVLLSNTTVEILQLVDRMLASFSAEGAVSALSYSANLNDLVISVISSSLITVFFTEFSNDSVKSDFHGLKSNLKKGISMLCLILLPISLITVMLGRDIVKIVYYRGSFGKDALNLTSLAIIIYAVSWIAVSVEKLFMKVFFALNDTKVPMRISIIAVLVNIVASVLLVHFVGFAGIPIGTVCAEMVSVGLNIFFLRHKVGSIGFQKLISDIGKMIAAALVTGIVLYMLKIFLAGQSAIIRFGLASIAGIGLYVILLIIMKCKEIRWMKEMIFVNKKGHV